MAKRHTTQTDKQRMGVFLTKKSDILLERFALVVSGKKVVDPFAGSGDLLKWAEENGAIHTKGYDIRPETGFEIRDSILDPPDYSGWIVVTNPPYLSSNKSKGAYKEHYRMWKQNDLYKCFLASLIGRNTEEALVIIPSNFLCESNSNARNLLFSTFEVLGVDYWTESVFDDASVGVAVLHIRRKEDFVSNGMQKFKCRILPAQTETEIIIEEKFGYLHGGREVSRLNTSYEFTKILDTSDSVNSKILVGCLDQGKFKLGFHYNEGEDVRVPKTVITNFQVNTVGFTLDEKEQREIIDVANRVLRELREKTHSFFLSNYMGAEQKILSQSLAKKFLSHACHLVLDKGVL